MRNEIVLTASESDVDIVVKLGGALLATPGHLAAALAEIVAAAASRRLLVVPGGGTLAEAVRELDRRLHLSDEAAHWMAVLAMDQHAHLAASRLAGGAVVAQRGEIGAALDARRIPVLAPYRWLRDADPLPHSWTVTSDSIAAWVAGQLGARHVLLIKAPHAQGAELVDSHFSQALPTHVTSAIVTADRIDALRMALRGSSPG